MNAELLRKRNASLQWMWTCLAGTDLTAWIFSGASPSEQNIILVITFILASMLLGVATLGHYANACQFYAIAKGSKNASAMAGVAFVPSFLASIVVVFWTAMYGSVLLAYFALPVIFLLGALPLKLMRGPGIEGTIRMIAKYIRKRDTSSIVMGIFFTAAEIIGIWFRRSDPGAAPDFSLPELDLFVCLRLVLWLLGLLCVPVGLYFYGAACNNYAQAKGYDDGFWLVKAILPFVIYLGTMMALHKFKIFDSSPTYSVVLLQAYLGVMILLLNGLLLKLLPDRSAAKAP